MTLRVYKDEYLPAQIQYIMAAFEVVEVSANVIIIYGSLADLGKVSSINKYIDESDVKKIFPDYLTTEEREYNTMDIAKDCLMEMQSAVDKMMKNGLITDPRFVALCKMSRKYYKIVMGAK